MISYKGRCRCGFKRLCKHIILVQDNSNTRSRQTLSFQDTPAIRSGDWSGIFARDIIASRTTGPSDAVSRSFETRDITIQELDWVELRFNTMEDKSSFEAAFDALKRQHEPVLREGKRRSNKIEEGSPTRKHDSTAIDAEDVIPPVAQKSANTEITPLYKAEAGQGGTWEDLPQSLQAGAEIPSSHPGEMADKLAFPGSLNSNTQVDGRKRSSRFWDGDRQGSIGSSFEGELRQQSLLPRVGPEEYIKSKDSRTTSWLAAQSRLAFLVNSRAPRLGKPPAKSTPTKYEIEPLGFRAPTAKSSRNYEQSHTTDPDALTDLTYDTSSDSLESVSTDMAKRDVDLKLRLFDLPVPKLETNTAQVSSRIEPRSSASSISETFLSEQQGSTSETHVDRKIQPVSIGIFAKQEHWRRRICQKIIVFMLWKREQDVSLPDELWSSPASIEFINVLGVSQSDKIKNLFETYSGGGMGLVAI